MVFNKQRKDPINDVMMSNQILSFKMLHKYALLKTGYEIIHKLGPLSITELFRRENPFSRRPFDFRLSSLTSTLLKFPQGSIPKEWNVLDESLKQLLLKNCSKEKQNYIYLIDRYKQMQRTTTFSHSYVSHGFGFVMCLASSGIIIRTKFLMEI